MSNNQVEEETIGDWAGHQPTGTDKILDDLEAAGVPKEKHYDAMVSTLKMAGFPHKSGDFTIIGPECFTNEDASVIAYKGGNYFRELTGGPQSPSGHDQEIEDLRQEISRYDDKLFLIERLVEQQAPFGSDLANFRRRLLLLVRA